MRTKALSQQRGGRAVVAAGHEETAQAAAAVLRAGGNAFDAAVAAGFASAVVEPILTSLGGGGFMLARTATGDEVLFDFFVDTPGRGLVTAAVEPHLFPITVHFGGSDQDFNVGHGSVAVPGNLKGYLHVHRRLGRLPITEVLAPAIGLARGGVPLTAHTAYMVDLLTPILTMSEQGRAVFAPAGRPLRQGERLANPDLARFLESIPSGAAESFYAGAIAARVARDIVGGAGLLTANDLATYEVIERQPLAIEYRGHRLLTNPPPARGGSVLGFSLDLLQTQELSCLAWRSAEHLRLLVAAMQETDNLRDRVGPAGDNRAAREDAARRIRRFTRGTTHVSIADAEGNIASMTTSNGEGSGYIVPDTGIMLNNMMGEDDLHPEGFHAAAPGQRVESMMAPSLVLRDRTARLVVGSGGSKRIRTVLLQLISHVLDFGVPVQEAVEAPRLHWDGECVQVEPGFPAESVAALRQHWPVNVWKERNLYFGGVNAVSPQGEAGADPRRGGSALIL